VSASTADGTALVLTDHVRVKGCAALPSLYKIVNGKCQVHLMNLTPVPLEIRGGVPVLNFEFTDLPIREFDLPTPSPVCAASHSPPQVNNEVLQDILSQKLAFQDGYNILEKIFHDYPTVLPSKDRLIGSTDLIEHSISLEPDAKPVYIPSYKIPHSKRKALENEVQGMLDMNLIKRSNSPWASPMILVPKKDGSFRPVVDYRKLNAVTIPEPFPIPNLRLLLQDIGSGNLVFSTLDLAKGFLQVPVAKESRPLTAFSTHMGHFEFLRTPFGLRNSPLTFSRLMSIVLSGMINDQVMVYLDDILICSPSVSEHEKKLRQVFERLASAGLTINPGKCQFFRSKLDFLGHTLTSNGIAPNQNKVQAVIDFPRPQNQKDLKSFLGLSGFYRPFIKDYGSIAQPLTTLLKKDVPFEWAKETEDSFLQLKALLANAPVLAFPDFELPFVLTTDASSVGLGATLHQKVNGKLRPIAFASRTLKPAERSYHTTDRELLAITYALRHFRELILGYKIEVHTDHSALTTALHGRDPHGRRARAIEVLAEYDVTIVYLPGRQNVVADALSRAPLPSPAELQACKSTPFPPSFAKRHEARTTAPVLANVANQPVDPPSEEEIRRAQREDPVYMDIIGKLERGEPLVPVRRLPVRQFYLADSGLLFRRATPKKIKGRRGLVRDVVVIPESLEPRVLQLVHESREAAHCGVYKAIQMARQRFFFPLLITKVKKHVKSCKVCPYFKGSTNQPAPALRYDVPDFPFEKVSCDTLSGFVTTRSGNKHILVFVDNFTRYCELVPVPNKSAKVVAKAFHDFIQRYTTPTYFSCDNGTEFQNEVMDNLCKIMNVTRVNILPYRPQSNGITERLNGSILTFMRSLVDTTSDNWDDLLLTIQSAINSTFHSSLGDTPHFLLYGSDKRLPYDLFQTRRKPEYSDSYAEYLLNRNKIAFQKAKEFLTKSRDQILSYQHKIARAKSIGVGALVFRKVHTSDSMRPKLAPRFDGPYRVLEVKNNKANCKCLSTNTVAWYHFDRLKLASDHYSPAHTSD